MTSLLNAIFFGCNICVTQCLKQLDENMKTKKKRGRNEKRKPHQRRLLFISFFGQSPCLNMSLFALTQDNMACISQTNQNITIIQKAPAI